MTDSISQNGQNSHDGVALVQLRKLLQLSQGAFAAELGISLPLERKLERGEMSISRPVRERLALFYGAYLEHGELLDEACAPYTREVFERRRASAALAMRVENVSEDIQRDLRLLLEAAREENKLHLLLPALREFLVSARQRFSLADTIEALRVHTITAGQVRAEERAEPLRRRLHRLEKAEEAQSRLPEEEQCARELAELQGKIAQTRQQIAAVRARTEVRGRRKRIRRQVAEQLVTVVPSDPNDKTFTVIAPEFIHWWGTYSRRMRDAAGHHGPEDA